MMKMIYMSLIYNKDPAVISTKAVHNSGHVTFELKYF